MHSIRHVAGLALTAFMLLSSGFVLGQQSAPSDYKLVNEDVLAAIDLAKEIDSVQGRELRLSSATIAPGGHVGLHSHRGDPTIVYVLSGVLTKDQSTHYPSPRDSGPGDHRASRSCLRRHDLGGHGAGASRRPASARHSSRR